MNLNGIFLDRLCKVFNWKLYDALHLHNTTLAFSTRTVHDLYACKTALFMINRQIYGKEN